MAVITSAGHANGLHGRYHSITRDFVGTSQNPNPRAARMVAFVGVYL